MYGNIVIANSKTGFVPSIIRKITNSKFSHSLITIPSVVGVPLCIEAASIGVSIIRFDVGYCDNSDQSYEIYSVNVSEEVKSKALGSIFNSLETSYGFLELPWFIWRALNKWLGRDIKNQDNWTKNGTICSELCVAYLEQCGLGHLFNDYGVGSVNAEDLRLIMTQNPTIFELIEKKE